MIDVAKACEFLAYWLGGTTRKELATLLNYTPRRVTTLIQDGFGRAGRTTTWYDDEKKRWMSADALRSKLLGPQTARDAVTILAAISAWAPEGLPGLACPVMDTGQFRVDPPPETFRVLLAACSRRTPVQITYRARTRDLATVFSPHTLVRTAHRLHFRGYSVFEDAGRGYYWDLVPSRVLSVAAATKADYVDASGDDAWHRQVMLHLTLHEHVPPQIGAALRREHSMADNHLAVGPLPHALLRYVRDEYLGRRYEGYEGQVWQSFTGSGIRSERLGHSSL
ncbi:MAG TPA: hypothetical protein VHO91_11015 [Rhodopila sp.]|nr:hypothetical protein [Rhodopila sp.]